MVYKVSHSNVKNLTTAFKIYIILYKLQITLVLSIQFDNMCREIYKNT